MYSVVQLVGCLLIGPVTNPMLLKSNLFTANTTISASGTHKHDGNYHVQLCLEARIYIRDSPLFPFSSFFSLAYLQYTKTSDLESLNSLSGFVHTPIARSIVLVGNSFPPRRLPRVNPLKAVLLLRIPSTSPLRFPWSGPLSALPFPRPECLLLPLLLPALRSRRSLLSLATCCVRFSVSW